MLLLHASPTKKTEEFSFQVRWAKRKHLLCIMKDKLKFTRQNVDRDQDFRNIVKLSLDFHFQPKWEGIH